MLTETSVERPQATAGPCPLDFALSTLCAALSSAPGEKRHLTYISSSRHSQSLVFAVSVATVGKTKALGRSGADWHGHSNAASLSLPSAAALALH